MCMQHRFRREPANIPSSSNQRFQGEPANVPSSSSNQSTGSNHSNSGYSLLTHNVNKRNRRGRPSIHITIGEAEAGRKRDKIPLPASASPALIRLCNEAFDIDTSYLAIVDYRGSSDGDELLGRTRFFLALRGIHVREEELTISLKATILSTIRFARPTAMHNLRKLSLGYTWKMVKAADGRCAPESVRKARWLLDSLQFPNARDYPTVNGIVTFPPAAGDVPTGATMIAQANANLPKTGRFINPVFGNMVWALAIHHCVYERNPEMFRNVEVFPENIIILSFLSAVNILLSVGRNSKIKLRFEFQETSELHNFVVSSIQTIKANPVYRVPYNIWLTKIIDALPSSSNSRDGMSPPFPVDE
ncbi:hypothetical protein MIND_00304800 [Mycena indigotica]|uniref:Uncharacterized protein n=1 Tax=Mycena indigotica TaxID=2126181 RepID=A0A8H6T3R2_9AGAR|nr:uncharacterized protein MIND_00304800 [Mycena indigotica]KAF7309342.1 hypothetical protein MIND_00304800 [Mycena indigotica]